MISLSRERPDSDIKQLVLLFIDQIVFVRSNNVTEKLIASFRNCVFSHIEDRLMVDGPCDAIHTLNSLG